MLVGNFVLYWLSPLPLMVHIFLSTLAIHLAFTIWHEAVHRNVSGRTWVNNLVGVVGMFPYMTPYFMQKWIHLQHHARLNEPDDPNVIYTDGQVDRRHLYRCRRSFDIERRCCRSQPGHLNSSI